VTRARRLLVRLVHRALANPLGERGVHRLSRTLRPGSPFWRKLAPQPGDFRREARRDARRRDLRWVLHPHDYCQWNLYFDFPDPVLDRAVGIVAPGWQVVDVGANVGVYTCVLANAVAGDGGRVHAFEPHPVTSRALRHHVELNQLDNVVVSATAVGDVPGTIDLVDAGLGDSGKFSARPGLAGHDRAAIAVSTTTLDDYLRGVGATRLDLLKVDVEGLEPEVLLGAADTLRAYRPVVVVELSPAWSDAGKLRRALDLLTDLGYTLEAMDGPAPAGSAIGVDEILRTSQVNVLARPPAPDRSTTSVGGS
jgi:FkbM family methyltransferase